MNRHLRLFIIALLEIAWILASAGASILILWRSVETLGIWGIIAGAFISIMLVAGVAGLVFLLSDVHHSLRVIEHSLEDLQEIKGILGKLAKIDYRIYELFYDQFYGTTDGEMETVEEKMEQLEKVQR